MDSLFITQDGSHSVFSEQYGVSYHSKYGAIQETRHVFIESGLYFKCRTQKQLNILEIGFGTGLNGYVTLLEAKSLDLNIYYEAIEAFPISETQIKAINYPKILENSNSNVFHKMHAADWGNAIQLTPHFQLKKLKSFFEDLEYNEVFDLIYFDAFAPEAQPKLWEQAFLLKMYQSLKTDGVLVTYCAKGVVKRTFKSLGFTVESLPGPPGKREMTRCIK